MFVNRERELEMLAARWMSDQAEFIPVYGRRRVGKTTLLQVFCADKPHVFWVADLASEAELLRGFSRALWEFAHPDERGPLFETWEQALRYAGELAAQTRLAVVIDEFPYAVAATPALPSILQRMWDIHLQRTRLFLVLSGSQIGMMEREVLFYRAPLYGRRTGQIKLHPLRLRGVRDFFPRYTSQEQVEVYAILGGIPAYLASFDPHRSVSENIVAQILEPMGPLYDEPLFLLREELREPRLYLAVLRAIAGGRTRLNEIAQAVGLPPTSVSAYLSSLRGLRLVERRVPVTERRPEKSKRGLYHIRDPFFRFWFRFVSPRCSDLERGLWEGVLRTVEEQLGDYVAPVFEELCREYVAALSAAGALSFTPEAVGGWWDRRAEVDVVALSWTERQMLLGETKWWSRPVGVNVLRELQGKTQAILPGPEWTAQYVLFSRAGFTEALQRQAKDAGILLVEAVDLLGG
jgi:AAA+ ATPase superfamily predicted ATPase